MEPSALERLRRTDLRQFWEGQLLHENFTRRTVAVNALAGLPPTPEENGRLRALINDKEAYAVAAAAIRAVAALDYSNSAGVIEHQAKTSDNEQVKGAALAAMLDNNALGASELMFAALRSSQPDPIRQAGLAALSNFKRDDARIVPTLRQLLTSDAFGLVFASIDIAGKRKLKELIPDLLKVKARLRFAGPQVDRAITTIQAN